MERRKLGELEVSAVGLGCATMTPFYGEPDPASAIETIRRAGELGIDFLDTSDAYGNGRNEELISRAVEGRRHELRHREQIRESARGRMEPRPPTAGRNTSKRRASAACGGCRPMSSISTISTESIRPCRSRTRSAR